MEYDGKKIATLTLPAEKIITTADKIFDQWKWLERRVDNIPSAVEFAVESCLESGCFSREEFKKKKEELQKAGKYETTACYIAHFTLAFSDLHQELQNNTKDFDPAQKATKEVIEKVVCPIGEKVIAEVNVDNPCVPESIWVFAI